MQDSITIKGLDELLKKINRLDEIFQMEIYEEVHATAIEIDQLANDNISNTKFIHSIGELRAGMQAPEELEPGTWRVANKTSYAGYIEFGTGAKVKIPAGFEDMAASWKGRQGGNFDDFLDRLEEWLRGQGISRAQSGNGDSVRDIAWLMAIHILHNGLEARPFMIPAFLEASPKLLPRIEAIIEDAIK